MTQRSNRRTFLLGVAAAAGAAGSASAASAPIRTAFIGVGNRGTSLLKQTIAEDGVNITAICDIDASARDRALSLASDSNPKSYTNWEEIIDLKDIDAVKIATPCYLHAEMAVAALKAGKYVYCEKPLGVTPEQVASVMKAAKGAKGFLQIGQQLRYFPSVRASIKALHEDRIAGDIYVVRAQRNGAAPKEPRSRPAWYEESSKSGDLIVENSVHNIDICNWIVEGHPVSAYGHGGRYVGDFMAPGKQMMDSFSVEYIYDKDTHVDYTQLSLHARGFKEIPNGQYYAIYGEKGTVFMTHSNATFYDMQGEQQPLELVPAEAQDAKDFAMQSFYECIRDGKQPFADIKVGATAALTAILGREAIYKGASVNWDDLGVRI